MRFGQDRATRNPETLPWASECRMKLRAGDGARTHDPQLGKLMLYQLSYAREAPILATSRDWALRVEARGLASSGAWGDHGPGEANEGAAVRHGGHPPVSGFEPLVDGPLE
jgi:hypothetical protein